MSPTDARHVLLPRQDSFPTASSTAPLPSRSPVFNFAVIDEMSTCHPAMIFFSYAGPPVPFNLVITNDGVQQGSAPPLPSSTSSVPPNTFTNALEGRLAARAVPTGAQDVQDTPTFLTVSNNLSPFSGNFVWPKVNLTQGWYIFVASTSSTGYSTSSSDFFIRNSSDVSCLISPLPVSSTHPSPHPSSMSSTQSSSASQTGIGQSPVPGSSSSRVSPGTIAGSVVGGLAVIGACIAAFLFIRRLRKTPSASSSSGRRDVGKGAWGGLGSTDSAHQTSKRSHRPKSYLSSGGGDARGRTRTERHNSNTDSLGPMISSQAQLPGATGTRTGSNSEEDVASLALSPFEEKFAADEGVIVDPVAPLPLSGHPTRRRSSGSSHTRPYRPSVSTDFSYTSTPRLTSLDQSSAQYPPAELIPMTCSPSSSFTSPPPFSTSPSLVQRSTSDASSKLPSGSLSAGQNRRTPRKPVPSYNPNEISLSSPSLPSADASRYGAATDVFDDGASQHSVPRRPAGLPELNHKSSFGPGDSRPLHYLMPDMPPPVRD